jgi:hypothetical protein
MKQFWRWYQANYRLNLSIAASLFLLQVLHLFWLLTHVIFVRFGWGDWFTHFSFLNWPLVLIDYTEIPALLTTSLVYINELRTKKSLQPIIYLFLLNIQWIHILWITDEFLVENIFFTGLAWWIAVLIDYLEVPVIIDTVKKLITNLQTYSVRDALETLKE